MRRLPLALTMLTAVVLTAVLITSPAHAKTTYFGQPYLGSHRIHTLKQAKKLLPGTSRTFKQYAARQGRRSYATGRQNGLSGSQLKQCGYAVNDYDARGYAVGNEYELCGGGAWEVVTDYAHGRHHGGTWRVIASFQGEPATCRRLHRFKVPASVVALTAGDAATCAAADGSVVTYRQK